MNAPHEEERLPENDDRESGDFRWTNRRPTARLALVEKHNVLDMFAPSPKRPPLEPILLVEPVAETEQATHVAESSPFQNSDAAELVKPHQRPSEQQFTTDFASSDQKLLRRLTKTTPTTRAVHAYIMQLLTDPSSTIGKDLRINIVRSLALAIVNDNVMPSIGITIVPDSVMQALGAETESEAIVKLALGNARAGGEKASQYINSIAVAFDSFSALDRDRAQTRIFADSESLSAKLRSWQREEVL